MRAARAVIAAVVLLLLLPRPAEAGPGRQVVVFLLRGITYEQAAADPVLSGLASRGGIALMTTAGEDGRDAYATLGAGRTSDDRDAHLLATTVTNAGRSIAFVGPASQGFEPATRSHIRPLHPDVVIADAPSTYSILRTIQKTRASELTVLVVVPFPTQGQRDRGDDVTPLVLARGTRNQLLATMPGHSGGLGGLSSGTTRRDGVVANIDVAPTVLTELGLPVPDEMLGEPIHREGAAPTELHRRYLAYQKASTPTALVALALALTALVIGVALLFLRRTPRRLAAAVAVAGLFAFGLYVAILPATWLPTLSFPGSLLPVGLIGAAITIFALAAGRRDRALPVAVVAGIAVVLVAADAVFGWPSRWNALSGERFYGLGNSPAGLVLGGSVLVAAILPPALGVGLLVAAALFAGLPFIGADFGGGATLFAVAALWYVLRFRRRFGPRELLAVLVAALAGMVFLILANEAFGATHVTRAVEASSGRFGPFSVFIHRLAENVDRTENNFSVLPALIAIPGGFWAAWRRPEPFAPSLVARPAWRDACVALSVGAVIGYVLNDTYGTASVAFIFIAFGLVFPALADRSRPQAAEPAPVPAGPTLSSVTR